MELEEMPEAGTDVTIVSKWIDKNRISINLNPALDTCVFEAVVKSGKIWCKTSNRK